MNKVTLTSTLTNNKYEVTNKAGNLVFKCDEPFEKGGSGNYPQPTDYLLAALGSCLIITIQAVAQQKKIKIYKLKIKLECEVETHGVINPMIKDKLFNIHIHLDLDSNLTSPAKQKFLQRCLDACPIHTTISEHTNIKWDY